MEQSARLMNKKIYVPALLAFALLLAACVRASFFAPPATLAGTLQVRTFEAFARDDRFYVKTVITNVGPQPVIIDRDGFALRLPNGQVLPRSSGTTTQHKPYALAPGQSHEVFVDFRAGYAIDNIPGATLVVGGITIGGDPTPRVVGEIPLSQAVVVEGAPPPPPPPAG